ncbi:MAG: hypothetical protein IKD45_01125 [Clostridia bacterium]|nr:hypothetical protein [Clostridia bacterium]
MPRRSACGFAAKHGVRITHPKIGKLACQAQGEGIFAEANIPVVDSE